MPLQNRVDPFGNIKAVPDRGTCMGNRGVLHREPGQLKFYHQHRHWVMCRLSFGDRQRTVMTGQKYTELFFLDEATALAAGHRPCAECSRSRYREFQYFFRRANPNNPQGIDDILHTERFVPKQTDWQQKKRTYIVPIDDLPYGAFILLDAPDMPYLVLEDTLRPWSFSGYGAPLLRPTGRTVTLLTPPATMRTLAAGYRPRIYPEVY